MVAASFICAIVDLLLCKTTCSRMCTVIVTTTLCLILEQHLRLWINMNPALGHRLRLSLSQQETLTQYWFDLGLSFATQAQN